MMIEYVMITVLGICVVLLGLVVWQQARRYGRVVTELKEENTLLKQELKDAYAAKKLEDEAWQRMMKTMQTAVLVNELCKQVVDGFMVKTCERVELRCVTDLPDYYVVRTNEQCLRKVLRHLMEKALQFTRSGSIILVVTDRGEKGMLTFSVSDTGKPDRHSEVNQTIVRMVMRLLGGYIHVDPHYKRGTRVIFSIRN
ncbi:MAG: HAMP domain-containing histidine kinase [Prevotella sp.]|nr:HAMP domain-containing histidine kinase [Prevotella sp.]